MIPSEDLVLQLRELSGCANLTLTDIGELKWQAKHRIFLSLLAELPEGKDAVMACAQLQMERDRSRLGQGAQGIPPEVARREEIRLREAVLAEVVAVLTQMGAAPALTSAKKLRVDNSLCIRAIGFLASRIPSGRRQGTTLGKSSTDPGALDLGGIDERKAHARMMSMRRRRRSLPSTTAKKAAISLSRNSPSQDSTISSETPSTVVEERRGLSTPARREWDGDVTVGNFEGSDGGGDDGDIVIYGEEKQKEKEKEGALHAMGGLPDSSKGEDVEVNGHRKQQGGENSKADCSSRGLSVTSLFTDGDCAISTKKPPDDDNGPNARDTSLAAFNLVRCQAPTSRGRARAKQKLQSVEGGLEHGRIDQRSRESSRPQASAPSATAVGSNPGGAHIVVPPWAVDERQLSACTAATRAGSKDDSSSMLLAPDSRIEVLPENYTKDRGMSDPKPDRSVRFERKQPTYPRRSSNSMSDGEHHSEDAVGLEMGIVGGVTFGAGLVKGKQTLRRKSAEVPAISASHAEVEALRVDNMQLRQRLEEMQALLDTQAAAGAETARSISSFAGSTSRTRIPLSARTLAKEVQSADQHRPRKSRSHGCSALDEAAAVDSMATATAAASEAILRGQVAQLRRQVRLQWTAVDASSAVTQEVKAVLCQLEATLSEICSLADPGIDGNVAGSGHRSSSSPRKQKGSSISAGGVGSAAALPAWHQLLSRIQRLARELSWAERAAQRAADGRLHVTRESGSYLQSQARVRGQRRPRDLRIRTLDPDHFTCPPPSHGAVHQQRPGIAPAGGYASVLLETPGASSGTPDIQASRFAEDDTKAGGNKREKKASSAAESAAISARLADAAAAEDAVASDRHPPLPGMHELYHLDPGSVERFAEAASAATRMLGALLEQVGRDCSNDTHGESSIGRGDLVSPGLVSTGVASLLLGRASRDRLQALGGENFGSGSIVETISCVRDTFGELVVAAAALGALVPSAPEGAGAVSTEANGPSMRLLRGVKAAGGRDGARRLAALARRIPMERAALEAAATASKAETNAWRSAAKDQAAAVLALAQGLRAAWATCIRRTSSLSRPLSAVLNALRELLSSQESAPILRGAAGSCAAALLQTLALFEPELEEAASRMSTHARRSEEEVSILWNLFEETCWPGRVGSEGEPARSCSSNPSAGGQRS